MLQSHMWLFGHKLLVFHSAKRGTVIQKEDCIFWLPKTTEVLNLRVYCDQVTGFCSQDPTSQLGIVEAYNASGQASREVLHAAAPRVYGLLLSPRALFKVGKKESPGLSALWRPTQ